MKKYIERDAIQQCRFIHGEWDEWILAADILKIPSADVAPVVHGKWKTDAKFTDCIYARCSECNTVQIFYYGKSFTKYCPECGAKMDL